MARLTGRAAPTGSSARRTGSSTRRGGSRAIELLVTAGILVETTGKKRDRSFVYRAYLDRLRVGTELARSAVHR